MSDPTSSGDRRDLTGAWLEEAELTEERTFTPWAGSGWHAWNDMSPEAEVCAFASALVKMVRPRLVIETGVGQGYMTRRLVEHLDGELLCFEADDTLRPFLRRLAFFREPGRSCSEAPSPTPDQFARADLVVLDSAPSLRREEIRRWWENSAPGSVALIHDTGDEHVVGSPHAALGEFVTELGIPGAFLRNPRGCYLGVKGVPEGPANRQALAELEAIKRSTSYRAGAQARRIRAGIGRFRRRIGTDVRVPDPLRRAIMRERRR